MAEPDYKVTNEVGLASRRLTGLSVDTTGAAGDSGAPNAITDGHDTRGIVNLLGVVYADQATLVGGETAYLIPWYLVPVLADPAGGAETSAWVRGTPMPVVLDHTGNTAERLFVRTENADRVAFQVTIAGAAGLAWLRADGFVAQVRGETAAVTGPFMSREDLVAVLLGLGPIPVDTELTLDGATLNIDNLFTSSTDGAATGANYFKTNAQQQAETDLMRVGGGLVTLGGKAAAASIPVVESSDGPVIVRLGANGAAADVDGAQSAQLRYIGEELAKLPPPQCTHWTPNNGTAANTSGVTITCAGWPFDVDDLNCTVVYVDVLPAAGGVVRYVNGMGGVSFTAAANVITIVGAGAAPFAGTDLGYIVGVRGEIKGFEAVGQAWQVTESSPAHTWGPIGPNALIAAAQNVTGAWADLGDEIEMGGYTRLGLWLTIDINLATDFRVRLLYKHTQAGAEEYNDVIETVSASVVRVEAAYVEFNVDADGLYFIPFEVDNLVPFVQVQIEAGAAGGTPGQVDAAYYTRSYVGG